MTPTAAPCSCRDCAAGQPNHVFPTIGDRTTSSPPTNRLPNTSIKTIPDAGQARFKIHDSQDESLSSAASSGPSKTPSSNQSPRSLPTSTPPSSTIKETRTASTQPGVKEEAASIHESAHLDADGDHTNAAARGKYVPI